MQQSSNHLNDRWRVSNDPVSGSVYIQIDGTGELFEMKADGLVATKVGSVSEVYPFCASGGNFIGFGGMGASPEVYTFSVPSAAPQLRE